MKKLIAGISVAVVWTLCVTAFTLAAQAEGGNENQFTVLAVKENSVKDYNSMPVFQDLARETGVDVKWKFQTSTQYSNNTDPVGSKGIDAIYHTGFSNLKIYQYAKRGKIVAIDQYRNVMPNFDKILKKRPDIKQALMSPDGHIYSLPRVEEMGLKQYPNILYINKTWIKNLMDNNKLPDGPHLSSLTEEDLKDGLDLTRDELEAVLTEFKKLDLNNDGKADSDITPLTFVSNNWQGNESDFIASFGVPENRQHKTVVDGQIEFTFERPEWFQAVSEMNRWHSQELIKTSAFTQTENDFLANGQAGKYGAFYWWEKKTVSTEFSDDYIIVKPLIGGVDNEGNELRYVGVSNEQEIEAGECVVLSSCEDKETLLSYFDKFFEPDYSAQLNYGSISSGAFKPYKEGNKLIPNDQHGNQSADDFRMKNAPYGVVYLTEETWKNSVQMESRAQLRLDNLEQYVKPYTYEGAASIPNLNYTADQLNQLNTYESTLTNNVNAWYVAAVISPTGPTEASWRDLINTNKEYIEKVKAINQAAYDKYIQAINAGK